MAWYGNLRIFFERIFPRKRNYPIGIVFFVIGLGFAFALTCLAVVADINSAGFWGDYLDAVKFDNSQPTQANLVKLSCPIILASGENANIATTFKNAQAKSASILVKAVVGENNSESYRVVEKTLTLSPGSSMEFSWQVDQK
ncbi:MAG TPA: hypothetical protein VMC62_05235, partial [Longilinea sp.]|nr:hypothetical protein [Longilinea sp.]